MAIEHRLPPLKALRALEALHQTGSVVGAARLLNVSHSAISHQIKVLENWTTHPLFVRHGRSTMLTAAGQSLAGVAHEAFESIRHETDRLPLRGLRSITIASLPLVATQWIVPRLQGFSQLNPQIKVHLSLAQTDHPITPIPDIEIRFALRSQLLPSDMVLISGTAVPVCSPELLVEYGNNPDQVLSHGPLVYDEDLRMWSHWLERAGIERDANAIESGLLVEGSALLRSAACANFGVALCRAGLIQSDIKANRLVKLSELSIDDEWCYFMRFSDNTGSEPGVSELAHYLKNCSS